jgi:WD40 repeat protein
MCHCFLMVAAGDRDQRDFFVSYAEHDQDWAAWIAWVIEEAGYRVRIKAWDSVAGNNAIHDAQAGIRDCDRFIAVLSDAYANSAADEAEWQAAWREDPGGHARRLVVIRIENCTPPAFLAGRIPVDLFDVTESRARERLKAMLTGVRTGRAKPSKAPPFPGAQPSAPALAMPAQPASADPARPRPPRSRRPRATRTAADALGAWSPIATLAGHKGWVRGIAFSAGVPILASGADDGTVLIWDRNAVQSGMNTPTRVLAGHHGAVLDVAFCPADGRLLASAGADASVRLRNAVMADPGVVARHDESVCGLAFSPDGDHLATASEGGTVYLWNVATATCVWSRPDPEYKKLSVAFSPDGQFIALAGSGGIQIRCAHTGAIRRVLDGHGAHVADVAFSPNGRLLASAGYADQTVRLWDTGTGATLREFNGHRGWVYAVAFSDSGRLLAAVGWRDHPVWLLSQRAQVPLPALPGPQGQVSAVAFSPDERLIASGGEDPIIQVWARQQG